MATWTKSQLANRALELVGVKALGQQASSQDKALAEGVVDSKFEQLKYKGKVFYSVEAVPEHAQHPLAKVMAYEMANDFGVSSESFARLKEGYREGYKELCDQAEGRDQDAPTKVIDF